jgi:hypothetical protein
MFSPSLIAMMHQSLAADLPGGDTKGEGVTYGSKKGDNWPIANHLSELAKTFIGEYPQIPTVGFTDPSFLEYALKVFGDSIVVDDAFPGNPAQFFWGRIPVNRLVEYFTEMNGSAAEKQFIDLGTTLRGDGSGSAFDTTCSNLMAQTGKSATPSVGVAVVDRGQPTTGQPENYQGKLRHTASQNLTLSPHAEKVLSVLLERLQHHGILGDTRVSCALVADPVAPVGRVCFRHANAVEMLTALKALRALLARDKLPLAMNISLGTHCGPHNGDSPLEECVARVGDPKQQRFFHVAAGNDGLSGVAAVKTIHANEREFFQSSLEQGQCSDFLVEFWWHDPKLASVKMDVTARNPGNGQPLTDLSIDSTNVGRVLKKMPGAGFGPVICKSLFRAQCRNQMSCIAFALSTSKSTYLPALDIQFAVESSVEIVMHAWIVVSDGTRSMFIEGDSSATIMVPASAPGVLSVAGVDEKGQPWAYSSRGPAVIYQSNPRVPHSAPMMAHLASLGALGEYGTSYASPRACGDTASIIKDPQRLTRCGTIRDLLFESYGLGGTSPPSWSPRTGFKAVSQ